MSQHRLSLALGIGLALSLLANAGAGYVHLQQRDALVAAAKDLEHAQGDTSTARAAAAACSEAVGHLSTSAAVMAAQLEPLRRAAAQRAQQHTTRAQQILSTPAAVPGDDCGSAQKRVADILQRRKTGGD